MSEKKKLPALRLGMVGGGEGAFIGAVHRLASRLDGHWELVAGALSSTASRSRSSGEAIGLAPDRIYDAFEEMALSESRREDGIDAVSIVTPNHVHSSASVAFLNAGIHVICDKPLAASMEQAEAIAEAVRSSGKLFFLTHNYSGYPLIRQAREMVSSGALGEIRVIQAEYVQDWLASEPSADNKQASWRIDPSRSGEGGCVGDIGTHAFHLVSFVTGLRALSVCADLDSFVSGRALDDNVHALLRYEGGAKGMIWSSQVAPGNENGLRLRVYGSVGGLEWSQENPNRMIYSRLGESNRILTRAGAESLPSSTRLTRVPPGHPEGYVEGFANLYSEAAALIRHDRDGTPLPEGVHVPDLDDGLMGMRFIRACVESSRNNAQWTSI